MKLTTILLALLTLTACTETCALAATAAPPRSTPMPATRSSGVTWKAADLWILTRPMELGEEPTTLILQESSSWGMLEGKVVIHEDAYDKAAR